MKKKILAITLCLAIAFSLAACKKKEEQPPVPQTGPMTGPMMPPGQMPPGQMPPGQMPPGQMPPGQMPPGQMPPGQMPPGQMPPGQMPPGQQMGKTGMMMPKGPSKVVIPDSVKGKWTSAKIIFEDKVSKIKTGIYNKTQY